jgi:hypothetical protein
MAIARFKDLCLDAVDPARLGPFWAAVLGRTWYAVDEAVNGPTPQHRIWINQVPEPKTVKHRVHLDVYTRKLADPEAQAQWWSGVYGVPVTRNDGWFTLEGVPGLPIQTMDFVPVPEPKTVKNRVHWDVAVPAVAPLVDAGATVLREPDDEIKWMVLADPEGNEFCAFT